MNLPENSLLSWNRIYFISNSPTSVVIAVMDQVPLKSINQRWRSLEYHSWFGFCNQTHKCYKTLCLCKITALGYTICTCLRGQFPEDKLLSWGTLICMGRVQRTVKLDLQRGSRPYQATSLSSLQIRKQHWALQTWESSAYFVINDDNKMLLVRWQDLAKQNIGWLVRSDFQINKYCFSPQYCMGYTYMNKVFFI